MNEIDPTASNGSIKATTDQEPTSSANHSSPLLSSLLSNGQQNNNRQQTTTTSTSSHHQNNVMNNTNDNTNNSSSNAFMTNNSRRSDDLTTTLNHNHRKYSNLSDLLQRNNNNNKLSTDETSTLTTTPSPPTTKSILENCLLKPSSLLNKTSSSSVGNQVESQSIMDHPHYSHPTTSSVQKIAATSTEDNRKVEPIKINLHREPIRSVIKLRPISPATTTSKNNSAVSPTLSSSSHSSESSYENNCSNNSNDRPAIQVIPKLHIRNIMDSSGSMNHEQSEPHIVPKITITGLSSPTHNEQQIKGEHTIVNSNSLEQSSPAIPKITIKKDNNDYHLNNDSQSISRLHIKNHHSHHHKSSGGMVAKIKEPQQQETIPKLTIKQVNNTLTTSPTFEKVVPKLLVKISKEKEKSPEEIESSSCSPTPSPPLTPVVQKLNIKPIPEKEVPKPVKNCVDIGSSPTSTDMKFSINRLIGSNEKESPEPLEINTTHLIKSTDSGLDSPRIILKINKSNNESITSEIVPQPTSEFVQKSTNSLNHKRPHAIDTNSDTNDLAKKPKLDENDDESILINDSDTSSSDNMQKNHKFMSQEQEQVELTPSKTSRSLRARRNHEVKEKPIAIDVDSNNSKENSLPETDSNALSNDATSNTNSVDETPKVKRGRGRPKKVVSDQPTPVVNEDSIDTTQSIVESSQDAQSPLINENNETITTTTEDGISAKKTPSGRGRGRGRGRAKRVVEFVKNGKPIQITLEGHDDDDSPSFSLYNRSLRGGFSTGKKSRGANRGRGRGAKSGIFATPERSKDGIFTTPEQTNRKKLFNTTTPSLFEEDTRMSIGGGESLTPIKSNEIFSNEESQSSQMSSTSNTVDGSTTKKRSKKMEVCEPEG
jgi:hypothetical protein